MANEVSTVPSKDAIASFESALAMALHLWQPLSFAVEQNLGGGDGRDKRDWLAGVVAELFDDSWSKPASADLADDLTFDVETRLIQVLDDEFATMVDDGSAYDVAVEVVGLWKACRRGDGAPAAALRTKWEAQQGKRVTGQIQVEDHWDEEVEDDEEEEDDDDDDMEEAPPLVPKTKEEPEVDEDGFTKVTRKKR